MQQVHIIYFTQAGAQLAGFLERELLPEIKAGSTCGKGCLQSWTEKYFQKGNVLVYIGACGIAVRATAPLLQGKDTDPAVLVMDEKGTNVIPLLSGHLGGANAWAQRLARITGGRAVLTTATDVNGLFAVDVFAADNDLAIDDLGKAGAFSARLLREKSAQVIIPGKYAGMISVSGEAPGELQVRYSPEQEQAGLPEENTVLISPDKSPADSPLQLIPRCIVLGMGCRRGKSFEQIRAFATETLEELGLRREAVCAIASIDVKKEEPGTAAGRSTAQRLDFCGIGQSPGACRHRQCVREGGGRRRSREDPQRKDREGRDDPLCGNSAGAAVLEGAGQSARE